MWHCDSVTHLHSVVNIKQKQLAQYLPRQRLVITGQSLHPLTGQIYDEFYKFASKQEIPASNLLYNQQEVTLLSGLMLDELNSSQADKTILSVPLNLKIMKD